MHLVIILPVLLYGCETWSLTLREEHRLSVLENRVLRRTFGPKKEKVITDYRKLYNEFNKLSTTPLRRMGNGCIDPRILTSALVGGEWSASRPGPRGNGPSVPI
jgi:hypothetical protein